MIKNKEKILKISYYVLIVLIICAGAFFRLWHLDSVPPGIHHDEAYNGLDAINAEKNNDYKIFYPGNNGREGLYINLIAFSFKLFGINEFSLRFASTFLGILTLIGFYLLIKQFKLSKLANLMSLFCFSFSFWHLNFSRIVYRGIMVPFLLVWIFYFFYKGYYAKKERLGYLFFILSGLLTGIGLHTYISFRVMPLILVIIIAFFIFFNGKKFIKKYWKGALIFFIGALITATPIIWFFYNQKDQIIGRSSQVSVFSQTQMSTLQAIGKSTLYHLGIFFAAGDPNQRHNHLSYPMLPASWAIVFAFGFLLGLKEIIFSIRNYFKKKPPTKYLDISVLSQAIFWTMLIPGVLSIEGIPHSLRIIGVLPAIFLFIAIPFEYIINLFEKIKHSKNIKLKTKRWIILKMSLGGLIAIFVLGAVMQMILYFTIWANHPKTASSFEKKLFTFGKVVNATEEKKHNFIITTENIAVSDDHKDSSLKTTQFVANEKIQGFVFWKPLEALKSTTCEDALYVFYEADKWLIHQFEKKCPELKASQIKDFQGYDFWIMR